MMFGAEILRDGVQFRLWAPQIQKIELVLDDGAASYPMTNIGAGWHGLHVSGAKPGTRYCFALPDGTRIPDPASRFQPLDVHGPSEVIDSSAYSWRDADWNGRPWTQAVIYELHVGAFTSEGTFRSAIEKLDSLVELGLTAIELMPIADFPGRWNWGYDGVLIFAPDSSYGRPEDLKALIDAAHHRGLMVFLDVVYNHFGPDGNYLPLYAPVFADRHKTPWGPAVNYDAEGCDIVRELIITNALYWIEEYHFDGFRLDAVHAIKDDSEEHLLEELARRVRETVSHRQIHLILENDRNEARLLVRDSRGRAAGYTAQWNDDIHHALHVAATGERTGYYSEYAGDIEKLGRALAEGFVFQGEVMRYRGEPRGEPSRHLPPSAFVSFIQNHDQIGNRAFGERLALIAAPEARAAIAAIYLLAPQIPMIFMGEEWSSSQPFPFFCDFKEDVARQVREGRAREFARFPQFQDPAQRARIPDPCSEETFRSAKLDWNQIEKKPHREWCEFYRRLIAVRHREIIPHLDEFKSGGRYQIKGTAIRVEWDFSGSRLNLCANLSATPAGQFGPPQSARRIWTQGDCETELGPWSVIWAIAHGND